MSYVKPDKLLAPTPIWHQTPSTIVIPIKDILGKYLDHIEEILSMYTAFFPLVVKVWADLKGLDEESFLFGYKEDPQPPEAVGTYIFHDAHEHLKTLQNQLVRSPNPEYVNKLIKDLFDRLDYYLPVEVGYLSANLKIEFGRFLGEDIILMITDRKCG